MEIVTVVDNLGSYIEAVTARGGQLTAGQDSPVARFPSDLARGINIAVVQSES